MVGDFNKELHANNSGMKRLMLNNNLCDIMWKVTKEDKFSTFISGSTRIDYVLANHEVYDCVVNACYEPFQYRNKGDHRTIVINFDTDTLLIEANRAWLKFYQCGCATKKL